MTRLRRIATAALVGVRPQNDGIDKIIYNGGDGSPAPRVVACGPNTGLAGLSDGCFTIGGSSEFGSCCRSHLFRIPTSAIQHALDQSNKNKRLLLVIAFAAREGMSQPR